jgi:hypothetical protein
VVLKHTPCGEAAPHSIESVFGLSTRTGKESGDDSVPSARPLFVARLARFRGILRLPVDRIAFVANREHGHELVLCPTRGCGEPKLRCGHGLHPLGDPGGGRGCLGQRIGQRCALSPTHSSRSGGEVPRFRIAGALPANRIFAPLRQQSVPEKPRRDGFRATAKIRRCQGKLTHSLAHFHSCSKQHALFAIIYEQQQRT